MAGSIEHGRRPGDVWFLLLCLCMDKDLPFELARLIHSHVMKHTTERRACEIVLERREREAIARSKHGVGPPTPLWQLLGFHSLEEFLGHKRWEISRYNYRKAHLLNASLPIWKAFGFDTPYALLQHQLAQHQGQPSA